MRKFVQIQIIEHGRGGLGEGEFESTALSVYGVTADGVLWYGEVSEEAEEKADAVKWSAIKGPPDGDPFSAHLSRMDKLEKQLQQQAQERDKVREKTRTTPRVEDTPPNYQQKNLKGEE